MIGGVSWGRVGVCGIGQGFHLGEITPIALKHYSVKGSLTGLGKIVKGV